MDSKLGVTHRNTSAWLQWIIFCTLRGFRDISKQMFLSDKQNSIFIMKLRNEGCHIPFTETEPVLSASHGLNSSGNKAKFYLQGIRWCGLQVDPESPHLPTPSRVRLQWACWASCTVPIQSHSWPWESKLPFSRKNHRVGQWNPCLVRGMP